MSAGQEKNEATAEQLRLDLIKQYEAAGILLIPLNGKIPIPTGWPETKPGQYKAEDLAVKNYGVVIRAGDLIIDVDPRHFKEGDAPLKRLLEDTQCPPLKTYTVRTGGGGLHVYLSKPADFKIVNAIKSYPGLEFKTAGQQVVGPGSIHPETGAPYVVAAGSLAEPFMPAPVALLALIEARPADPLNAGIEGGKYTDDAQTKDRYTKYLQDGAPVAIEGEQGDAQTFKVAATGRDYGLSPNATFEAMAKEWNPRCSPPWEPAELQRKVSHAYKYASGAIGTRNPIADFTAIDIRPSSAHYAPPPRESDLPWITTAQGEVKKCFQNLLNYLVMAQPNAHVPSLNGVFGYNEFTSQIEFLKPAPWHRGKLPKQTSIGDYDLKMLKTFLVERHGFEMPLSTIDEGITAAADKNKFHPVREYLQELKWDGKKRLDSWLSLYCQVESNPYTAAVGRKTLCAAVARIFRPGIQFDHVLILEGRQKLGKTSICRILGGDWYGDPAIDPHDKDTIAAMQGKWILELAELSVLRRAELNALKAFITRLSDKARLAYGRLSQEFPRQCVFIGTINPGPDGTYLQDNTGNRRFWPVEVRAMVDFKGLKENRDQLWAEAVVAVTSGKESLWLDSAEISEMASQEASERHAEHPWTERIVQWLNTPEVKITKDGGETKALREFVTGREIFLEAMGGTEKNFDRLAALGIAEVMRALGWERTIRTINGVSTRGYFRTSRRVQVVADPLV